MHIIGIIVLIVILYVFIGRKHQQQDQRAQKDVIDIEGTVVEEDKDN